MAYQKIPLGIWGEILLQVHFLVNGSNKRVTLVISRSHKWNSIKYFYHKQIRKSEIVFLFFLAKDVVDNLLNSIHSYVGKNYAYTVIDLCRWFNAVRIGSNDAIKFLLVTSRLNMKYELLVTTVIVIRSFHENTWRIHHIISGLMHPEQFSNFEWCMQLFFI